MPSHSDPDKRKDQAEKQITVTEEEVDQIAESTLQAAEEEGFTLNVTCNP